MLRLRRILVVDEKPAVLKLLRPQFKKEGFEVWEAQDGASALEIAKKRLPALIIMDLSLPGLSGVELYNQLKSDPATQKSLVLILSEKSGEEDKIAALEMGVDDYVTKPFSPREVALRARAILRPQMQKALGMNQVKIGDIEIHRSKSVVKVAGDWVALTRLEFKILELLGKNRGCVQTRQLLLQQLWGFDSEHETRTVDTHIRRLRGKLGEAARQIVTIRGFGYRLDDEVVVHEGAEEFESV